MKANLSPIVAGMWRLPQWKLDAPGLARWIAQALDLGISTFDHADIYGGYSVEAAFGEALAAAPGLRDRVQIVTKCGIRLVSAARPAHAIKSYDTSHGHVVASVENSLRVLRTDRIDLLLIHRPDPLAEPDEIAEAFRALHKAGKVLAFGVSNHSAAQFAALHRRHPLATNQVEFSPLQMKALADGTLEQCTDLQLPPMAWSPLARGRLFGDDEQARRVRAVLEDLGRPHGASAATMAYAWILRHPSRPRPITGSGRVEALREAVAALAIPMSREDWTRVWVASMGHGVA